MSRLSFIFISLSLLACAGNREQEKLEKILQSSAGYHIKKANAAVDSGYYDVALHHIREAIALVPYEPIAFNNLGVTFFHMGKLDSAIAAYQTAIRLQPTYTATYNNLAQVYLAQKQYRLAIAAADNTLEYDPLNPDAYILKAVALSAMNQQQRVIQVYRLAVKRLPDHENLRLNLGGAYYDSGMLDEAIVQYQQAIRINTSSHVAYFNLGNTYARLCTFAKALENYQKAISLKPDFTAALNNLALILMAEEKLQQSIESFLHAYRTDTTSATVLYNLSIAEERSDSLDRALTFIDKAIEYDSTIASFYVQKGNIYDKLDKQELALEFLQKAVAKDPQWAISYNNLGNVLMTIDNPLEARLAYEKAIELFPDYLDSRYFAVGKDVARGVADLIGSCVQAEEMSTKYAQLYYNLGLSYVKLENEQDAVRAFERAIRLQPSLIGPYENLAEIYRKQNKPQETDLALAKAYYNRAQHAFAADSLLVAENLCRQSLRFKTDFAAAYAQMGQIYERLNDPAAADLAFKKALNFGHSDAGVLLTYGSYLAKKGLWQQAINYFQQVHKLEPRSEESFQWLVKAWRETGNEKKAREAEAERQYLVGKNLEFAGQWDRALERFSEANQLDTTKSLYLSGMGLIYAKKHHHKMADSLFSGALKINPRDALALYGMGITHGDQQDYGEAIRFLKKSILIDSTYAQAHFALAVNYYFAGKYDSAQIHVKRAQDLGMEVKREFISEVESRQR